MQPDELPSETQSWRKQIFTLILISSIPVHIWTILMLLRDYSWVLEDFTLDIFIGYANFALVAAFVESLIAAGGLFLLGLMISKKWPQSRKLALQVVVLLVLSLWAAGNQTFFILLEAPPKWFNWILLRLPFHQLDGFIFLVLMVIISVGLPVFLTLRFPKFEKRILQFVDRLCVLAYFYLGLDLLGGVMVIFRLLRGTG